MRRGAKRTVAGGLSSSARAALAPPRAVDAAAGKGCRREQWTPPRAPHNLSGVTVGAANAMTDTPFDAIIIGAGPAGTATAARLHQRGVRRVLLLDRAHFPRDKPCGGGLTGPVGESLAALGLRLQVPHLPSPLARIRFGGYLREVPLRRPVNVVRRLQFDASLVEQVAALGVEVETGAAAATLEVGADAVTVRLDDGRRRRAQVVVGADGVASIVRKHLAGGRQQRPHRLFTNEIDARADGAAMTYDFTPMAQGLRGYLWLFPLPGGGVNVGLMHYPSTHRVGAELQSLLRAHQAQYGLRLAERARGWPLWGFDPRTPVAAPRLLAVGDAAGIDGLTGEGISVALEQGAIAGDAVAAALQSGDFAFAGYARALRGSVVGRELLLDRWLAARVYQAGDRWRHWLAMMLFDRDFLALYAARVAGTEALADRKLHLARLIGRHALQRARRLRQLQSALAAAALPASAAR